MSLFVSVVGKETKEPEFFIKNSSLFDLTCVSLDDDSKQEGNKLCLTGSDENLKKYIRYLYNLGFSIEII